MINRPGQSSILSERERDQACLCKSFRVLILDDRCIKRQQWRKKHQLHSSFVFNYLSREREKEEIFIVPSHFRLFVYLSFSSAFFLWIFFSLFANDRIKYLTLIWNYRRLFSFLVFFFSNAHVFNCCGWAVRARSMNYHPKIYNF